MGLFIDSNINHRFIGNMMFFMRCFLFILVFLGCLCYDGLDLSSYFLNMLCRRLALLLTISVISMFFSMVLIRDEDFSSM